MAAKEPKKVYRYWISKADKKLHKEICYAEIKRAVGGNKTYYLITSFAGKIIGDIPKDEFENHMLERSANQYICLYKENDSLAYKHFIWAINEKIKSAKETLVKYEDLLEVITLDADNAGFSNDSK